MKELFTTANLAPARCLNPLPSSYRLLQKKDGTLVLQGCFGWYDGNAGGHDWKDIPTEVEK